MKDSLSLKFYLKPVDKRSSKIILRITANRKKAEVFTGYKIHPDYWNEESQRATKNKSLNEELLFIENEIYKIKRQLVFAGKPLSASLIKKLYTGEAKDKVELLDYFETFINKISNLPKEYKSRTVSHYKSTQKYVKEFCSANRYRNIFINEVDQKFISDFDYYLRTTVIRTEEEKEFFMEKNSANKHHSRFRTVLLKAMSESLIEKNPYKSFPLKYDKPKRTFLTDDELDRLIKEDLKNASLERVRDMFLFSVYTGLRFSDAINLKVSHIKKDKHGKQWIEKVQEKTGELLHIPLLDKAIEILKKYENEERRITGFALPRISNQKLNTYLKTIADLCEIDKELTHHVARHTFATTITLSNNVPLEVVSKLLGHTDIKTTQIYAKITNNYLSKVASELNEKI